MPKTTPPAGPSRLGVVTAVVAMWCCLLAPTAAAPLVTPANVSSVDGLLDMTLTVSVGRVEAGDFAFNARLYDGVMPGRTLYISANDTVRVNLVNTLEANEEEGVVNEFRQPNTTNLHTHGLHVSSEGHQDNMFLHAAPGESVQYEYSIHPHHLGGTHWYHPHFHGSSTIQVGGGMAGVLVVRDDPASLEPALAAVQEQVLMLQYVNLDGKPPPGDIFARHDRVSRYSGSTLPLEEEGSGAAYLVNGQLAPTVTLKPGEWQRWRMVHASTGSNIQLDLSDGCEMQLIANDGVYLIDREPLPVKELMFVPGSRRDVLIRCSAEGSYSLSSNPEPEVHHLYNNADVILHINVAGDPVTMDDVSTLPGLPPYMEDLREATATDSLDITYGDGFGLPTLSIVGLAVFTFVLVTVYSVLWYREVLPQIHRPCGETDEMLLQDINVRKGPLCHWLLIPFSVLFVAVVLGVVATTGGVTYDINGVPYEADPTKFLHTMSLGSVQDWQLESDHPFHIHVNHFQFLSMECDDCNWGFLLGNYYDTIMLGGLDDSDFVVRFKPADYPGIAMFHCHILGHEDLGMMALANVVE